MSESELSLLLAALEPWSLGLMLAMARAAGMILGLPHLSASTVPRAISILVVLSLGIAIMGSAGGNLEAPASLIGLAYAVGIEFLFGLSLGFVVHLALAAPRIAGELAGIEMGLSFAAVADPLASGQSTALSSIFAQLGVQLFLALGLDRATLVIMIRATERQPLGGVQLKAGSFSHLAASGQAILEAAVTFALPIMGALICLKLAMAMLARVAPRLQIFSLAFALSIGVGILMLHAVLPSIADSMTVFLRHMVEVLARFASQ